MNWPWTDWNVCNLIFSSVVVGNLDATEFLVVVSGCFPTMGCSLLASVLLSVFRTIVMGTNLAVVVSGLNDVDDDDGIWFVCVIFWCWILLEAVGFGGTVAFVVVVICDVNDVEWYEVAVVDGTDEPNEKCGIVFWSMLFSTISGSTMSVSS